VAFIIIYLAVLKKREKLGSILWISYYDPQQMGIYGMFPTGGSLFY